MLTRLNSAIAVAAAALPAVAQAGAPAQKLPFGVVSPNAELKFTVELLGIGK